jgi:hypothetical protein
LAGEHQRLAGDEALQLRKRYDRARKGDGADRSADAHLDQAGAADGADDADPVSLGIEEGRGGDEDRGHADEAVESGDKLRQRRHLNAKGDGGTDCAADNDADEDKPVAHHFRREERGDDGDGHAGHAVEIACARALGRREASQCHDEADGGHQIGQRGHGLGHLC